MFLRKCCFILLALLLPSVPALATTVAEVNGVQYDTLAEAVADVPDGVETTIRLVADVVLPQPLTISQGQIVVFDMAGYAMTVEPTFKTRPFTNYGTLTIQGNGSIDVTAAGANGYGTVNNYGTLIVRDGVFTNAADAPATNIWNREGATAVFHNPTIYGSEGCIATAVNTTTTIYGGFYSNMLYPAIENRGDMSIQGGTFVNTSCSACSGKYGYTIRSGERAPSAHLTIQGAAEDSVKVTGTQGALAVIESTADIYNGVYETVPCKIHADGSTAYHALYVAGESGKVVSNIYGGTFQAASRVAARIGNSTPVDGGAGLPAIANFYGGTFVSGNDVAAVSVDEINGGLSVYGGTYTLRSGTPATDVTDYLAPGYAQNADGSVSCNHSAATEIPEKAASCTEAGSRAYWYCPECGKYFADAAFQTELSKDDLVIDALGHDFKDGVCTRCGERELFQLPATGDGSHAGLWLLLMLAVGAGICGIRSHKRTAGA